MNRLAGLALLGAGAGAGAGALWHGMQEQSAARELLPPEVQQQLEQKDQQEMLAAMSWMAIAGMTAGGVGGAVAEPDGWDQLQELWAWRPQANDAVPDVPQPAKAERRQASRQDQERAASVVPYPPSPQQGFRDRGLTIEAAEPITPEVMAPYGLVRHAGSRQFDRTMRELYARPEDLEQLGKGMMQRVANYFDQGKMPKGDVDRGVELSELMNGLVSNFPPANRGDYGHYRARYDQAASNVMSYLSEMFGRTTPEEVAHVASFVDSLELGRSRDGRQLGDEVRGLLRGWYDSEGVDLDEVVDRRLQLVLEPHQAGFDRDAFSRHATPGPSSTVLNIAAGKMMLSPAEDERRMGRILTLMTVLDGDKVADPSMSAKLRDALWNRNAGQSGTDALRESMFSADPLAALTGSRGRGVPLPSWMDGFDSEKERLIFSRPSLTDLTPPEARVAGRDPYLDSRWHGRGV